MLLIIQATQVDSKNNSFFISQLILRILFKVELLSSLMFSMLKQMIEDDRSEKVREAATKSFALIMAFVDDKDKYTQVILLKFSYLVVKIT